MRALLIRLTLPGCRRCLPRSLRSLDVATLTTQVAALTTEVATLNTEVATNTAKIATNTANIATLTARNQILNGAGAPAAGLGNNGDLYINKTGSAGTNLYQARGFVGRVCLTKHHIRSIIV